MKEILIGLLEKIGLAFWVEIKTDFPACTYYFGPFLSRKEAEAARSGYLEDLQGEGARDIESIVKRCKPTNLTIFDENEEGKVMSYLIGLKSQIG